MNSTGPQSSLPQAQSPRLGSHWPSREPASLSPAGHRPLSRKGQARSGPGHRAAHTRMSRASSATSWVAVCRVRPTAVPAWLTGVTASKERGHPPHPGPFALLPTGRQAPACDCPAYPGGSATHPRPSGVPTLQLQVLSAAQKEQRGRFREKPTMVTRTPVLSWAPCPAPGTTPPPTAHCGGPQPAHQGR